MVLLYPQRQLTGLALVGQYATFDTAVANGAGIMFKVLATQMNAWQLLVFSCML